MRFYKNLKDDLHCFQAALLIVLSVYFPKKKYSYKEIDKISGFKKGAATWDSMALYWLAKKGFDVVRISSFDYKRFAKDGEAYLKWFWRPDVYEWQEKVSDFKKEQKAAKKLLPYVNFKHKNATVEEIEDLWAKHYSIIASVNPRILDNKKGYSSHSVVVTNMDASTITFHDPGLPPQENRKVTHRLFQKALQDIIALRK